MVPKRVVETSTLAGDLVVDGVRFTPPSIPTWFVRRERLLRMLDASAATPLVLVSAPAGSGKTVLVADWVRSRQQDARTVWVTATDGDEPLWPAVLRGFERAGLAPPERIEGLDGLDGHHRATLVLDGFELTSTAAAADLGSLLDIARTTLRVVVVTRVDPLLPLYRYRLSETLVEVRAADLAFSDREARGLLRAAGLALSERSVRRLNARTRGWAAGLRFAAKALLHADDADDTLTRTEAATADVNEYLLGEVLNTQPPATRQFLLDTSVPAVMSPGLVEELAGRRPFRDLAQLSTTNVFVEVADAATGSYRYYPFFRDLLRAQLAYEAPERMADLQRRTGMWLLRGGALEPGVQHLAEGRCWELAASAVVDRLGIGPLLDGTDNPLAGTLREIPEDLPHPAACVVRAALALGRGDDARCARELDLARTTRAASPRTDFALRTCAAVVDALRARIADSPGEAAALADRAAERLAGAAVCSGEPPSELTARVRNAEGVARLRGGDRLAARQAFNAGLAQASGPFVRAEALSYLALLDAEAGHLSHAERNAAHALAAADGALPTSSKPPAAEVALGWVALDRYELDRAHEHLRRATRSWYAHRDPVCRGFLAICEARLLRARGELPTALASVRRCLPDLEPTDPWLTRRLRLEAAGVLVAAGEPAHALRELGAARQEPDADLLASMAYLAGGDDAAAADCLARVENRRVSLSTSVTLLVAQAGQLSGRQQATHARECLQRGLRLAMREQMRRPFLEAPPPVRRMLTHDAHLAGHRWVHHPARTPSLASPARSRPGSPPAAATERLTPKELEVLRGLADMLSTEEIAAAMFVSVNTVRTHVRNILRKLGVNRRSAAVRRGRELGVLR
jgi:LuxR family transcriptional regulator, maltose regulon positive regulatory protein